MEPEPAEGRIVDTLVLRFDGREQDGAALHELRAAHVAEVLQGIVGLSSDFAQAGAFGEGTLGGDVLVRPAREGSFIIEVLRFVVDHQGAFEGGAIGGPTLGSIVWWSTKRARAEVEDFEYLDNGNVKVIWQDDTVDEIPEVAWRELQKRKRRRKKQLRQIMAPLSDPRVTEANLETPPGPDEDESEELAEHHTLTRTDYDAVQPEDDVEEGSITFEVEAQMSAIDFDNPSKWRVKTPSETRAAVVEDEGFLGRIANGLAIRKSDIFRVTIREDRVERNGRNRRTWTVLKVNSFRRASGDDDT